MSQKTFPVTVSYVVKNGELVLENEVAKFKFNNYYKTLVEGARVEVTYEQIHGDSSYAQLSKLHASIRELANFTGMSFEEMKLQVKINAGLCKGTNCVSFADCSREELSMAIQSVYNIAEKLSFALPH